MRLRIFAIAVVAMTFTSSVTYARELIQMDFDGVVTYAGPAGNLLLSLGDPLHARVVYDTNANDLDPSPLFGRYAFEFMEVSTRRGLIFRSGPSEPGTVAGLSIDRRIERFEFKGFPPFSQSDHTVDIYFPAGTFANDRPPTNLPFGTATNAHYTFRWIIAPASRAALTEYSAAVVPDPANSVLAGALFSLIVVRRRHSVSSQSRSSSGWNRSGSRYRPRASRYGH